MQNNSQSSSTVSPKPTTLRDLVVAMRIRKGPSSGTTKRGAFWSVMVEPQNQRPTDHLVMLRNAGGDGVGSNPPNVNYWFTLRHYRDGEVSAVVERWTWHQNQGNSSTWLTVPITECTTAEEVVVMMKGTRMDDTHILASYGERDLIAYLTSIGLPSAAPSPDDLLPKYRVSLEQGDHVDPIQLGQFDTNDRETAIASANREANHSSGHPDFKGASYVVWESFGPDDGRVIYTVAVPPAE